MLFYVRQKHQDLLTQLAVSIQSYLAIDIIIKNNIELIKGVDRASTTTISALRTAVIVAQALGNQKLVLDQITALNTTTSDLIQRTSEMLRDNSAQIQQQAASATIGLPQLQAAFANIYATMDSIDTFKLQALDTMAATIGTLETEVGKSREYLDRVSRARPAAGLRRAGPRGRQPPAACAELRHPRPADTRSALTMGFKDWVARITGRAPSRTRPRSRRARPRRPSTTSWPRWTGSRRWSPAAWCRPPVQSRVPGLRDRPRDHAPAAQPRTRQPGGVLGDGDRHRLPARGDRRLPRLPRQWADSRPIENGKTSLMLLIDQLDLLAATMDKIFDAVVRVDADALIAHGRFLQEKFGHASTGGDLDLGHDEPAAGRPAQQSGPAMTDERRRPAA